jgi:hypothetical protein
MIRRITLAAVLLLIAVPLAAQSPEGWQLRVDRSTNSADPDDVPEVEFTTAGSGFQINTGPAAVAWNPENTVEGPYTLDGRFTLIAPSDHVNYYGLVYGGRDLEGVNQNYLYFLVAQDGSFIIKHRAGDGVTHDISPRGPHDAVVQPDASGRSVNQLQVRVGENETEFVVNGTVVYTLGSIIQARLNMPELAGMRSTPDGIWGVRVNHRVPGVLVEGLRVR